MIFGLLLCQEDLKGKFMIVQEAKEEILILDVRAAQSLNYSGKSRCNLNYHQQFRIK